MDEDEDDQAAVRSALQHAVGTICANARGDVELEPEAARRPRGFERPSSTRAEEPRRYCRRLAGDLPAFARHAKRSTAGVDDVLLVARRNPELLARLGDFVGYHDLAAPKPKGKRKADAIVVDDMDPRLR